METLKHLLGMCGESHWNLFTITIALLLLKLIYEKYFSKIIWWFRSKHS